MRRRLSTYQVDITDCIETLEYDVGCPRLGYNLVQMIDLKVASIQPVFISDPYPFNISCRSSMRGE
jgi:hypothetical protein